MADSRDIDLYTYRFDTVYTFYSFDVGVVFHTISTVFHLSNSTNQFLANGPSLLQTEVCWEHFCHIQCKKPWARTHDLLTGSLTLNLQGNVNQYYYYLLVAKNFAVLYLYCLHLFRFIYTGNNQ